jgi:hypothetical protein
MHGASESAAEKSAVLKRAGVFVIDDPAQIGVALQGYRT